MEVNRITGKISEDDLELLARGGKADGSGRGGIWPFVTVAAGAVLIAITLGVGACPTSSCTTSCVWMQK